MRNSAGAFSTDTGIATAPASMLDWAATTAGGDAVAGDGKALPNDGDPGQAASISRTIAALRAAPQSLSGAQRLAVGIHRRITYR